MNITKYGCNLFMICLQAFGVLLISYVQTQAIIFSWWFYWIVVFTSLFVMKERIYDPTEWGTTK